MLVRGEDRAGDILKPRHPRAAPTPNPPGTGAMLLRLQRAAGNQAVIALLAGRPAGRVIQRHTDVALNALPDGTDEPLDVPSTVTNVPPVLLKLVAAPAAGNEVTRPEFLALEAAWARFLEDRGGLQMRAAFSPDTDYTDTSGTLKSRQASTESLKHGATTGKAGTFPAQKIQMIARIGTEIGRSKAARELFVKLVGATDNPATHVVRMFLGEESAGFYDAQSDFSWDIGHEGHVHEDPTQVGSTWTGVTRGELLMHVLEERYYMVVQGKRYDEAHQLALRPNSLQNQYRQERAKEKGGATATTSPTVVFDCEPFNRASGSPDPSVDAVFDPAKEKDLADFVAIDAVGNLTRARGIDITHLHAGMPAPSTTLTTVTHDPAYAEQYFNRAFALCINDLDAPGEKPKPTFEQNVNRGKAHFDSLWTMVQGGMRPPPAPGAATTAPATATAAPSPTPAAQLKARWTQEVTAAKLRTEARRAAIEAKSATNRGTIEQAASDPSVTADPGNEFLLAQRDQRAKKVINEALKHQDVNCAACSVGGITLLSSTELLQQFRADMGHPNLDTAGDFIQVKERQDPEAWLKATNPAAQPQAGTASSQPEVQYEVDKGNAVWNGIQSTLTAVATARNADPVAGGGATWATTVYREPNMPGSPDYVASRGAQPLKTDIIPRMQGYPDGTQFVMWVFAGPPDVMQHYIYAEKFAGHVVIEDLQQNFQPPKRIANRAHVHIDEVPAKPLVPYTTDYFTHGCFVALTPTFTAAAVTAAASPADITFQTNYRTRMGQSLRVVGSAPELGAWNPQAGLELRHSGDGDWSGSRTLAIGGHSLHYKYAVIEGSSVVWESDAAGTHHTRRIPAGTGANPAPAQQFTDNWGNFAGL